MEKKQDLNKTTDYGRLLMKWDFPEYPKYKRGVYWYLIVGLLFLGAIIYSIIVANFLFALFLILFAIVIIFHARNEPAKVEFGIYESGLKIGARFYEWSDIKNFRIVYQPPQIKRLYIDLKNVLLPDFSVSLEDEDPIKVRGILKNYLLEDLTKEGETWIDWLGRWLKI